MTEKFKLKMLQRIRITQLSPTPPPPSTPPRILKYDLDEHFEYMLDELPIGLARWLSQGVKKRRDRIGKPNSDKRAI